MRFWYQRMPYLEEFARSHKVLHLGPGREERFGTTIDYSAAVKPDVLHDLNVRPYPFADDTFDAVYGFSVIEHLDDPLGVLEELHRILKPGGFVALLTPHFSDAASYIDPTHKRHLSAQSFDYLIPGTEMSKTYGFYSNARFRVREKLLMLHGPWRYVPLLQRAANRWVQAYERHWCFMIRGQGLYFELEAIK